jgi:outer membrane protein OmpA-like peptidoglycan-associated protein
MLTIARITLVCIIPILLIARPKGLKPLEPFLNTRASDFAPALTADGKTMYFNSRRGGTSQDLYVSTFVDGRWTEPVNLRELNSSAHDETPFITPDGSLILFSSDRESSLKMPMNILGNIENSYDLYRSRKIDGHWTAPERIPGEVNTIDHERAPSICLNTNTLYFTSWPYNDDTRPRIMKASLVNGQFTDVQILPAPFSTAYQDMALVPNSECTGFYFSSKRPDSIGGWDIYSIAFTNGAFGTPKNMGPAINSTDNEFFYSKGRQSIYLCSNRSNSKGRYDIYALKLERTLRFAVLNAKTKKPLTTTAVLSYEKYDAVSGTSKEVSVKKRSDPEGAFSIIIDPYLNELDISIKEKGFLPLMKTIHPEKIGDEVMILAMTPLEKEASFDIHSIHFDFDSATIRQKSYRYLDSLASYLKENAKIRFSIIGHTDLHGPEHYNKKLSLKRARSVRDYLIDKGIAADRFEIEGAGESNPRIPKKGPPYDEQNRRTEFKVIGID